MDRMISEAFQGRKGMISEVFQGKKRMTGGDTFRSCVAREVGLVCHKTYRNAKSHGIYKFCSVRRLESL